MHWFRKARYVVALCVVVFTRLGLATQAGEVPPQALAARSILLAAMLGLVFWFDNSILEWLRS